MNMMLSLKKSGADSFFVSFLTGAAASAIMWAGRLVELPLFIQGVAAGMILMSTAAMFLFRRFDEYTLATWNRGASAGFSCAVVWFVLGALASGSSDLAVLRPVTGDAGLVCLTAFTAFLAVTGWSHLGSRR